MATISADFVIPPGPVEGAIALALVVDMGSVMGQALAACRQTLPGADECMALCSVDPGTTSIVSGPLAGRDVAALYPAEHEPPHRLPALVDMASAQVVSNDAVDIARRLAPQAFPDDVDEDHRALIARLRHQLIDGVVSLGHIADQAEYQSAWRDYEIAVDGFEQLLAGQRFLLGTEVCFADYLFFGFAVRIDPVYYELYKANAYLLAQLPNVHAYACDLYETPELFSTTDFEAIKRRHYLHEPLLNVKRVVPRGGIPALHSPQFRAREFAASAAVDGGTEEDQGKARIAGEWVRPQSRHRKWISADGSTEYPAEPGRYHVYAPYNCPWSHRALLARAVKGLEQVVGATVVYFRRDPQRGWQLNPAIPGCTDDPVYGLRYVVELYERVGSEEKSVPVLWDTKTHSLVSNESAEILRMFNQAFGDLAGRADLDLYPAALRDEIDQLNDLVYQRINNGAYKAGFTSSQLAYERAFDRYFAALDWLEALLGKREWLAGSEQLTEADLRLFPTVFRHDAVYFTRFKLNARRIADYPKLSAWLRRMLDVPGVAAACNQDHARNGYFGRTGNEIVPLGPEPLTLSRADYPERVWLNLSD